MVLVTTNQIRSWTNPQSETNLNQTNDGMITHDLLGTIKMSPNHKLSPINIAIDGW